MLIQANDFDTLFGWWNIVWSCITERRIDDIVIIITILANWCQTLKSTCESGMAMTGLTLWNAPSFRERKFHLPNISVNPMYGKEKNHIAALQVQLNFNCLYLNILCLMILDDAIVWWNHSSWEYFFCECSWKKPIVIISLNEWNRGH